MVIADSSVWITFQRNPRSEVGRELDSLLAEDEIVMVGPVLTEVIQGVQSQDELAVFAERLGALTFLNTDQDTWIRAGELNFRLARNGSPLAVADLIISALAIQHDLPVYTVNGDFQRVPGLVLHQADS